MKNINAINVATWIIWNHNHSSSMSVRKWAVEIFVLKPLPSLESANSVKVTLSLVAYESANLKLLPYSFLVIQVSTSSCWSFCGLHKATVNMCAEWGICLRLSTISQEGSRDCLCTQMEMFLVKEGISHRSNKTPQYVGYTKMCIHTYVHKYKPT